MKFAILRLSNIWGRPCDSAYIVNSKEVSEFDDLPRWEIKINTIEELSRLSEEVGSIIFDGKVIKIYDDYAE